jgi:hypothetical protein
MGYPSRASIERTDRMMVFMGPVSQSSYVITGPELLSPTPGMLHGRKNEVTQNNGRASLSLIVKTSSGCSSTSWGLVKGYPTRTT